MNNRFNSLDAFTGRVILGSIAFGKSMSVWICDAQVSATVFFVRINFL